MPFVQALLSDEVGASTLITRAIARYIPQLKILHVKENRTIFFTATIKAPHSEITPLQFPLRVLSPHFLFEAIPTATPPFLPVFLPRNI